MTGNLAELEAGTAELLRAATAVRAASYSPYSGFAVGAAIEGADGRVYAGCNVETVAYNNSLHAEMGAISRMVAEGCRAFTRVLVVTESIEPVFPCGFCLQYLSEFGCDAEVIAVSLNGRTWRAARLSTLLPLRFKGEHLRPE